MSNTSLRAHLHGMLVLVVVSASPNLYATGADKMPDETADANASSVVETLPDESPGAEAPSDMEPLPDESGEAEALVPVEPVTDEPAETLSGIRYREAITELESAQGAYAAPMSETLLGLGIALQRDENHSEAIRAFRRGIHLARINDGLYTPGQIPMLQREIASHLALGQYADADERQAYLYRVQMRSQAAGITRAQAFMQQAQWQYTAYRLALDGQAYARVMSMWDLYRLALTDIMGREGETSPMLLQPLEGMLLAQYLIADYDLQSLNASSSSPDSFSMQNQQNRFNAYRAQSYKRGQAVIQAIYDIQRQRHGDHSMETATSRAMLGDWMLWHGEREAAMKAYREAVAELTPREDAEVSLAELFGEPAELPAIEGASRLPMTVAPEDANLQLQFGVDKRGKVVELERVDENELNEAAANRVMRALRRTQFRPRLAMGEPQDTETVTRAYEIQ